MFAKEGHLVAKCVGAVLLVGSGSKLKEVGSKCKYVWA